MLCRCDDVLNGAELFEGLQQVVMVMMFRGQITYIDHVTVQNIVLAFRNALIQIQTRLVYRTAHLHKHTNEVTQPSGGTQTNELNNHVCCVVVMMMRP